MQVIRIPVIEGDDCVLLLGGFGTLLKIYEPIAGSD
jgi:hypothetical protein